MFQYEDDLKNHRRRDHTAGELLRAKMKLPDNKCPHCGKGHLTHDAMRMHILRVCGKKIKDAERSETVTESENEEKPVINEPKKPGILD